MSERVKAYFTALEKCSSEKLDRSAVELASREKQDVARLIAHIAEIGQRKYDLTLGYSGLFEYCLRRLNLGEGTVHRRTQVAGVCRRFPQILEALHAGRLHLTGASLIAPHLTAENAENIITSAQGKTKRELLVFLATLAPKKEFKPSLRKKPASKPVKSERKASEADPRALPPDEAKPEENTPSPLCENGSRDLIEPATEERYNFRFSLSKEVVEKFQRAAEVLNISSPHCHIAEIFDRALEALLDKKDPQRRQERRQKRQAKQRSACPGKKEEPQKSESGSSPVSRYIPPEVRDRILEKAGHQCEYRGLDGERCSSRTGLEIDHTLPFSVYHTNDEAHLRVLCPAHNLHEAEEFFGREFVQEKIKARQGVSTLSQREHREEEKNATHHG